MLDEWLMLNVRNRTGASSSCLSPQRTDGREDMCASCQNSPGYLDPEAKNLQFVCVNWFWAECHPREPQAFDETSHWQGCRPAQDRPLKDSMLVLPSSEGATRPGVAWMPEEVSMLAVLRSKLEQPQRKQ